MAKAILFDFFGTLVQNGVERSPIRQIHNMLWLDIPFHEFIGPFEKAFMLKKFDNLFDAFKEVCAAFNLEPRPDLLNNLVGLWNRNKLMARPFPETIEVLEELKKKYKLALISNTDCFSIEDIMLKYNLNKYFDVLCYSYKEGYLKTDPELFKIALERLGMKEYDAIMVGDSLESDIAGATQVGIHAILIDRMGRREFSPKIADLRELSAKIDEVEK